MRHRPAAIFSAICVVAVGALAGYLYFAAKRSAPTPALTVESVAPAVTPTPASVATTVAPVVDAPSAPVTEPRPASPKALAIPQRIFFRHNGVESHYGSLAFVDLPNTKDVHFVDTLRCEAVHVSGGHGICLSASRGVFTTYAAALFDAATFKVSATFPLKGIPSRSRVSADGTLAALTVFVTGHGYSTLDFSTQTLLIDVASGAILADLETFKVSKDGAPIESKDFNFWGVTFTADAQNFYATLSTAGKHYLIRGDVAARTAEVIRENVECPSLSPDARHVAYKKRFIVDNRIVWQLHVLSLEDGRETALSEKRSIDDQLEWLGNRKVLYSVPSDDGSGASTDVWITPIDGSAPPTLFLRNAYSPATVRDLRANATSGS